MAKKQSKAYSVTIRTEFQIGVYRAVGFPRLRGRRVAAPARKKRMAGSAEGGLERLGARGSARRFTRIIVE